jgi:hypothetical protein
MQLRSYNSNMNCAKLRRWHKSAQKHFVQNCVFERLPGGLDSPLKGLLCSHPRPLQPRCSNALHPVCSSRVSSGLASECRTARPGRLQQESPPRERVAPSASATRCKENLSADGSTVAFTSPEGCEGALRGPGWRRRGLPCEATRGAATDPRKPPSRRSAGALARHPRRQKEALADGMDGPPSRNRQIPRLGPHSEQKPNVVDREHRRRQLRYRTNLANGSRMPSGTYPAARPCPEHPRTYSHTKCRPLERGPPESVPEAVGSVYSKALKKRC